MGALTAQWSAQLNELLTRSNQRIIVDITGDFTWCCQNVMAITKPSTTLVLSEKTETFTAFKAVVPFNKSIQLLGQEINSVVYDAFNGFDVDAFVRCAGLIKSPGVLILLRPQKKGVGSTNKWHGFFADYLEQTLSNSPAIIHYQQNSLLPSLAKFTKSAATEISKGLSEQQATVWQQLQSIFDKSQGSIALLAARGRGKSTLLGKWLSQKNLNDKQTIITSDSKKAVGQCLQYLAAQKGSAYCAIDTLLETKPSADCVMVDEAATLPMAQLFELKKHYARVIYTSTTEGYEGTGNGFQLKFLSSFKQGTLKTCRLTRPMRWGDTDLLEQWLNDTFLLKPSSNTFTGQPQAIHYQMLSQQELNENKVLLQQSYQLLKQAHYRTKPSDLKMMMDNPNLSFFIASDGSNTVGVVLLCAEGGLDEALSNEIYYGRRRPQGHLFAQALTVQTSCKGFAMQKGYRVQRIAVTHAYRKQGIGKQLIKNVADYAKQQQASYLSAMFALDDKHIKFWHNSGLRLVLLSGGQGTSTGMPSLGMMLPFKQAAIEICEQCQHKLQKHFSERLLTQFSSLSALQVLALLPILPVLGDNNRQACEAYIDGFKGFNLALADLRCYVLYLLQSQNHDLSIEKKTLLVQAILQQQAWPKLVENYSLSGKKELNQRLKECLRL